MCIVILNCYIFLLFFVLLLSYDGMFRMGGVVYGLFVFCVLLVSWLGCFMF